jgi:transcriptional regulator with AAA-type ATPase domain
VLLIKKITAGLLFAGLSAAAFSQDTPPDYSNLDHWLCHPGKNNDACDRDLTTTIIKPDATFVREPFKESNDKPIDCFYVYPTTSLDKTGNSDLIPGEQGEIITAHLQTARLRKHCRVYGPIYRQITIPALRARIAGQPMEMDRGMAYQDVLDSWNHYLKN